jgi:alpha-amylase
MHPERVRRNRGGLLSIAALLAACGVPASSATADGNPVWLQWFETRWETIEYRMPDFYVAGYDSTWIPPCWKAADPTSAGFDVFDRFDLGRPGAPTAYGTEATMKAMVDEFHRAAGLVYCDLVMNHNSGRNGSTQFRNEGGYPGFWLPQGSSAWGDFNDGTQQSQNPSDPNYNLFDGDLVGLVDIRHQLDNRYIRNPVGPNAQNLPPGTLRNLPDANNARFYPDLALPPRNFVNPAVPVGDPLRNVTLYPFNTTTPLAGDAVVENANDYLVRSTRWMLETVGVDGFRLDAAKHIPVWFWNNIWDSGMFQSRVSFGGSRVTPFSFGEVVESNSFTASYTRKDGFGNRDALDLNGAGALRDLRNSGGFGSWQNVLNAHLDTQDDGFNNGTLGVNHYCSHDNGTAGNGGSAPPFPSESAWALPMHAYLLFRPGASLVYHNSREFIDLYQFRGFWPREGNPSALGAPNADLIRLVQLSNGYARGDMFVLNNTDPVNQSNADVLIFERKKTSLGTTGANVLVGVSDSFTSGTAARSVHTSFPPGTRLRELTGNSESSVVDSGNQIPQTLVVDANRRVTLIVPHNRNTNNVDHYKGYVVYAPATPSGTLSVLTPSSTIPADSASVPTYRRRLTPMDVVTGNSFTLRLQTTKTDPIDPAWDDFAAFRINQGFVDRNGNGGVDFPESDPYLPGFERFLTVNQPLFGTANTNGIYAQVIDTTTLPEGPLYIEAIAFRNRPAGTDPLYTQFRKVVYVDRLPPSVTLADAVVPIENPIHTFRVTTTDRTVQRVHIFVNLPNGTDPLPLVSPSNQMSKYDRWEYRRQFSGLQTGTNTVTLVAFELSGRSSVTTTNVNVTIGSGDVNRDGRVTIDDLYAAYALSSYDVAADLNADGQFNAVDLRLLEAALRPTELHLMSQPQR